MQKVKGSGKELLEKKLFTQNEASQTSHECEGAKKLYEH